MRASRAGRGWSMRRTRWPGGCAPPGGGLALVGRLEQIRGGGGMDIGEDLHRLLLQLSTVLPGCLPTSMSRRCRGRDIGGTVPSTRPITMNGAPMTSSDGSLQYSGALGRRSSSRRSPSVGTGCRGRTRGRRDRSPGTVPRARRGVFLSVPLGVDDDGLARHAVAVGQADLGDGGRRDRPCW